MANSNNTPPPAVLGDIDLGTTRLHYVVSGSGPPLIIVPATVSLIRQWMPLAQFMGQYFTSYFFELPGHGGSSPYPGKFESRLVPGTVAAFADALGYDTFHLMGFSFGGMLAMRTLEVLHHRIERVALLSPALSHRAILYAPWRQWVFRNGVRALQRPRLQAAIHSMLNNPQLEMPLTVLVSRLAHIDQRILASKQALRLPRTTLDVFAHTVEEIFSQEFLSDQAPFKTPCYFGMSLYDDLLRYDLTEEIVRKLFTNLTIQQFDLPYHQPPHPPTYEWLNEKFGHFLTQMVTAI